MFYRLNLPVWERWARGLAGIALIALGLAAGWTITGSILAGAGGLALLTGFVGFCPMCAMAGRRLRAGGET